MKKQKKIPKTIFMILLMLCIAIGIYLYNNSSDKKIAIISNAKQLDKVKLENMAETYNVDEVNIPESFDLRDKIQIKVENQGTSSLCYVFASLTSVETNLALIHNDYVDLSEAHLAGNISANTRETFINADNAYYKNKIGPVYENGFTGSENSLNGESKTTANRYVEKTISLPPIYKDNIYSEEINNARKIIKTHIMKYGSLYASISSNIKKSDDDFYVLNAKYSDYPNHAISIIGWDDNFSRDNFPITNRPNTDGAYLALNSYGNSWGDNGCFWISYEDYWVESNLNGVISVNTCQENISFENIVITDKNDNREISYKIAKGINAQIEVNMNINEIINSNEQIAINVISPNGKDISGEVKLSGNYIENNKSKILLEINTSLLLTGEYFVKIKYEDEILVVPIVITIDTYDFRIKEDGSINITGYYGKEKKIIIPKEFYGFSVTGIEERAFRNNNLASITIYENITEIGENIIDESVIIYGNKETYIEKYANEKGYIFIDLNNKIIEGQGWYFESEDNKLYILENYTTKEYDYLKKIINKVELRSPVQEIFSNQFEGYEKLEEVILADTITSIGEKAFAECYDLKNIQLSKNITRLEAQTFYSCKNLESIDIPEGVTEIRMGAFHSCTKLQNINVPKQLTIIGDYAFYLCEKIKKIDIPSGLTSIGSYAFFKCTNLENINLPEGLKLIGDAAFYDCKSICDLDLPISVTTIGNNVFEGCILNKIVEVGTTELELPSIIKRAITTGDILNCGSAISFTNGKLNIDKLNITQGFGKVLINISAGKLKGFTVSIIISGAIEYNTYKWTSEDVTATLFIGKGEYVINNGGEVVYKFSENGKFEFEYININGENKKVIAKVENIDKTLPQIIAIENKDEQGFTESITATISDEQAGLWSGTNIGYLWSISNTNIPTDWITADIPNFVDEIKEVSFDIDITGMSGKYYLWIYKNAFYDMASNGFEKKWELASDKPYYLGSEPIFQEIKITNPPTKTIYLEGENFNKEGMKVIEQYHNGMEIEVLDYEVVDGENLTVDRTFITINYNKNEKNSTTTQEIVVEEVKMATEKYKIQDQYILKIKPKTTIEEIIKNIECNTKIEILDCEENYVEETSIVGTGYKLKLSNEEQYTLIVWGDFNGDGEISIAELARASRLAVKEVELELREKMIIDVSTNGTIEISDLAAISRLAVQ